MDLIVSWVLFPALLLAVCIGCGLLVELACGRTLPAPLLPVTGLATVVVLGTALMVADATAELAAPACVVLALGGYAFAVARLRPVPRTLWPVIPAAAVFGLYAAPIVLSGEATIAGFIKLDDTATWLAFTDRIAEHGRDLEGLAPSTYEATLSLNLGKGYPVGAFVPLAISSSLTEVDPAWLLQAYMALAAAFLALVLWELARPIADRPAFRAAAAIVGAQSALLVGYYLWGGVKEVLGATLLAALAALLQPALEGPSRLLWLVPSAVTAAAVLATLSAAGAIWLLPFAIGAAGLIAARRGWRVASKRAGVAVAGVAILGVPALLAGELRILSSPSLTADDSMGNLAAPLDPLQLAGIWGSGDFRFDPADELATYLLAGLACALAAGGVLWAVRRRVVGVPLFVGAALAGAAVLAIAGSPWVEGKAFATASVAIPFAAMLAAGILVSDGRPILGGLAAVAVAGGVLWSNALAYLDVDLAPRAQLEELERIGRLVDGEGPTLITEYSPYGARHFLRDGDPESVSELRRREIRLRDGTVVPKGESADTDRIEPGALSVYRSLVVRRSPVASRPPSAYRLTWAGADYELWQREADTRAATERLGLGGEADPVETPACERVRRLASSAPPGADLVGARRAAPIVLPLARTRYPDAWGAPDEPRPVTAGSLEAEVEVARAGEYELWLGGSVRPRVETRIDGRKIGARRHELNNEGGYVRLGTAELGRGAHRVEVEVGGTDLAPGSDGSPDPIGPLALASGGAAQARLVRAAPEAAARRFCGRPWDWIEVVAGG